jgi:dinuclear metal center YbgI/SA1388 family protein
VIKLLNDELNLKVQEQWDNSGLQIGCMDNDISKIMLTLDIDKNALKTAVEKKIDLILTHHPFLFDGIKSIDFGTYDGQLIKDIILNGINIYSLHTSLDMADYGVNYELSRMLGIDTYEILHPVNSDKSGYGGIGRIKPLKLIDFAGMVKQNLCCQSVKLFCSNHEQVIERVAFCGGSGSEFIADAVSKDAQVYVTGDIKYHQAQEALKNNLSIIDAGHYYTEYFSLEKIKSVLEKRDLDILLLKKNTVSEILI